MVGEQLRGRALVGFCRVHGMVKEKGYDYIIKGEKHLITRYPYKGKTYKLFYVSGCFYPMVFEVE